MNQSRNEAYKTLWARKWANTRQAARFDGPTKLNADMTNRDIRLHDRLKPETKQILDVVADKFCLSPCAYMRTIKVAVPSHTSVESM